jgi:hypothetical protein
MDHYPIQPTGKNGRGMVIAGLVLGFIFIVAAVVLITVYMVLIHGLANNTATF